MSLKVLVAHSGDSVTAEPVSFGSLDAFKSWLAQATSVAAGNQILLTPSGKQVKLQALLVDKEIFLYDRQLISPFSKSDSKAQINPVTPTTIVSPDPVPDTLSDQNDIQAWRALFKARRKWAQDLAAKCRSMSEEAQTHLNAFNIIQRGLGVAVDNLQSHVRTLQQRHGEAKAWSEGAAQEEENMLSTLETVIAQLPSLPANREFMQFLPQLGAANNSKTKGTLEDFAGTGNIKPTISTFKNAHKTVSDTVVELDGLVNKVKGNADHLVQDVEHAQAQSVLDRDTIVLQLEEEVEVVAKKIHSDYEHVLGLPATSKSIPQISKMALLHTRNYLPSLRDSCTEMADIVRRTIEQRNDAVPFAISQMKRIAEIEGNYAQVNAKVMELDLPAEGADAYDKIGLLSQLPFIYGALLIEAVRRREWSERLKNESAVIAEDIAGYREEEERRRKKWLKSIGHFVSEEAAAAGNILKFELNLEPEDREWPEASRDDISSYLQALRNLSGLEEVIEELSETAKELDKPTRRQVKRAKGFKMGSVHEATNVGKGSFLLQDDDELKLLRDSNTKLEEDLKTQRSRVRKLEDLVYRQTGGRSSSGNVNRTSGSPTPEARTPEQKQSSPGPSDARPGRSGSDVRRLSSNKTEEKTLARRIVTLEAELHEERQKRQSFEQDAQERMNTEKKLRTENEESNLTKRDLTENMEAQQREFSDERRMLEEKINEYKLRAEEAEDELERVIGSRENEKTAATAQTESLERELENSKQALADVQEKLSQKDEVQEYQLRTLRTVYANLSAGFDGEESKSQTDVINALDELAERVARHERELNQIIEEAKAEKESLTSQLEKQEREVTELKSQIANVEQEAATLRNDSAAEKARATSLASDLEDARTQLRALRTKFAEGETGSEALRQRLEEQAAKASRLSSELAESKSHVNSLDVELSRLQRKHESLLAESSATEKRLEQRTARDRALTNRLVAGNNELARLLDTLGLSVIHRDGAIAIQRTSKIASSTANLSDPTLSTADVATQSQALPVQNFDVAPDPSLQHWMLAESAEEENEQFKKFISKIDDFNLNTFSEAIVKLRRDVEWTGRKWKMDARTYRDKYHRAHRDSHEKIAFRSFKEGDLALFLPTRNQATRPWAAFNVGAPHYFLREQDSHRLQNREWLVARISKIEDRVVDLSKTMEGHKGPDGRVSSESGAPGAEDDNPFELSDGLRWYLLDAAEEKIGAPATPGLGKSTVASAAVDAKGSIRIKKTPSGGDASAKLNKSLESRRSSANSRSSKRNSISSIPGKDNNNSPSPGELSITANAAPASGDAKALELPRTAGAPRPGSRGSNHNIAPPPFAPSGLGIEIAQSETSQQADSPAAAAASEEDQHQGASPHKPLLHGLFGGGAPRTPSKPRPKDRSASASPSPAKGNKERTLSPPGRGKTAWESLFSLDVSLEGESPRRSRSPRK